MAFLWVESHLENPIVFRASMNAQWEPEQRKKIHHQKISQKNLKTSSAITKHLFNTK